MDNLFFVNERTAFAVRRVCWGNELLVAAWLFREATNTERDGEPHHDHMDAQA